MIARQESRKNVQVYPTHAELYCRTPQNHLHCYKAEAELSYVIFFLIKFNWLDNEDLGVLSIIHPDFKAMTISIPRLLQVDFTSRKDPVLDYASHTSIAPTRVRLLTACTVHYDCWTSDWLLAILASNIQQNGTMSTKSFLPASHLLPLKYSVRWSIFSPQDVHHTSIGKKTQPTSTPLSLGATFLLSRSTVN